MRAFGASFYRHGWPTRDGVIPYRLFFAFFHTLPALEAGDFLAAADAHRFGAVWHENPKAGAVRSAVKTLRSRSLPIETLDD